MKLILKVFSSIFFFDGKHFAVESPKKEVSLFEEVEEFEEIKSIERSKAGSSRKSFLPDFSLSKDFVYQDEEKPQETFDIDKFKISELKILVNFRNFHAIMTKLYDIYALRFIALMFNNFSSFELHCDEYTLKNTKILQAALADNLITFYTSRINKQVNMTL